MRTWAAFLLMAMLPMPVFAQAPRPEPRPAEHRPEARPADPPAAVEKPKADEPQPEPPEPKVEIPAGPPIRATLREDGFAYSACLLELTLLGADFDESAPLTDPDHADCGIARPITLRAPLPGIQIDGGAVMRCDTARHLAHWLRDFVRPATVLLPGQPQLAGLEPGSTYQCRPTIGNGGESLSEHAFGNAFDIAAFRFLDGSRIEITPRQDDGDLTEAFQQAVRKTACLHFTTVLGPGANAAHENHLHLDIKARKGGFRLCQ